MGNTWDSGGGIMWEFLAFRNMISVGLIQLLYFLGALVLTAGGIGGLIRGQNDIYIFQYSLLALTAGNVVWRLLCEGLIVIYRIHATLESIDRKLGRGIDA